VGPDLRQRRRDEILCHLWESEAAGIRAHRMLSAAVRGLLDDVGWSCRRGWRYTIGLPEAWVAIAACCPIVAWIGALLQPDNEHPIQLLGGLGGPVALAVSGLTWLRRRRG
jgi:hypothetical protein